MKFQNICSVCMCFKLQSPFRNEANTLIIHIASFYYKSQENKVRCRQLSPPIKKRFMHSSFMDLSWNLSWVISKRWWWRDRYLTFWVFPSNIFNSFRRQNHSTFQGCIRKWFSSIICFDVILLKFNFDILIRCRLRQWCKNVNWAWHKS